MNDDTMQLDDSKHKVYIYNLDDELSDSDSDDGKLIFLPDIEKHLRSTRIPASLLANPASATADQSQQLVLYNVPSSLSVPEEHDSVRKAIIEARARARANEAGKIRESQTPNASITRDLGAHVNGLQPSENNAFPLAAAESLADADAMEID
jgi:hypothetical protein